VRLVRHCAGVRRARINERVLILRRAIRKSNEPKGIIMSGWRPLIKGYFGVALVVGAVMSSAFGAED
jgi:hypothetical protein